MELINIKKHVFYHLELMVTESKKKLISFYRKNMVE